MTQTDMGLPLEGLCSWCRRPGTCKHQGSLACDDCAAGGSTYRVEQWLRMFAGLQRKDAA